MNEEELYAAYLDALTEAGLPPYYAGIIAAEWAKNEDIGVLFEDKDATLWDGFLKRAVQASSGFLSNEQVARLPYKERGKALSNAVKSNLEGLMAEPEAPQGNFGDWLRRDLPEAALRVGGVLLPGPLGPMSREAANRLPPRHTGPTEGFKFTGRVPQPETVSIDFDKLPEWLVGQGIDPKRAELLTINAQRTDLSNASADDLKNYLFNVADTEVGRERRIGRQRGFEGYNALYNPETQLPREYEASLGGTRLDRNTTRQQEDLGTAFELSQRKSAQMERDYYENLPDIPNANVMTAQTVERLRNLSPALQRYFANALPGMYSAAGMPEERAKWFQESRKYVPEIPGSGNIGGVEDYAAEADRNVREEERASRMGMRDPWADFLADLEKNAQKKFQALGPRERGFSSGRLAPATRRYYR